MKKIFKKITFWVLTILVGILCLVFSFAWSFFMDYQAYIYICIGCIILFLVYIELYERLMKRKNSELSCGVFYKLESGNSILFLKCKSPRMARRFILKMWNNTPETSRSFAHIYYKVAQENGEKFCWTNFYVKEISGVE